MRRYRANLLPLILTTVVALALLASCGSSGTGSGNSIRPAARGWLWRKFWPRVESRPGFRASSIDVITYHYDDLRTAKHDETFLTLAT